VKTLLFLLLTAQLGVPAWKRKSPTPYRSVTAGPTRTATVPCTATGTKTPTPALSRTKISPSVVSQTPIPATRTASATPIPPVAVTPSPNPGAPRAPGATHVVENEDGSTSIYWSDNSANEDGFKIERQLPDGTWEEIGRAPANFQSFQVPPPAGSPAALRGMKARPTRDGVPPVGWIALGLLTAFGIWGMWRGR
jgi:hypothetical protein